MAPITDETVFQDNVSMVKCLPPPSEMVQIWKLVTCLAICADKYKHLLGVSNIQLDVTHTPVKPGGKAISGRKKS